MVDSRKIRVEYIDIAKAIGIFCVLIGHTLASDTLFKTVLYSFHMPLFFFLSGMVIKKKAEKPNWKKRILSKAEQLLVPFLLWGCIYSPFSFKNLALIMYGSREALIKAESLTSLWFLPVLFIASVLTEIIVFYSCDKPHSEWRIGIIAVIFCVGVFPHMKSYGDPWGIDIALVATAFMLLGFLCRRLMDEFVRNILIQAVVFGLSVALLALSVLLNNPSEGYVLMANGVYGNMLLFIMGSLAGITMVILIAKWLSNIKFGKQKILLIGENTLGIFLVHKPFVEFGRRCISLVGMDYSHPIIAVLNSAVCLVISMVVVAVIDHWMPELFGKKRIE